MLRTNLLRFFFVAQLLASLFTRNAIAQCVQADCAQDPIACIITKAAVGIGGGVNANVTADVVVPGGRTSKKFFPVSYAHDGGSGSYTVVPKADADDTGIPLTQALCVGQVTAIFNRSGSKAIKVEVTQSVSSRVQQSANSVRVVYDETPPVLTINSVIQAASADAGTPIPFSGGTTFFTSNAIVVQGRVNDVEPAQDPNLLAVLVQEGLTTSGQVVPVTSGTNGTFSLPINLSQEQDGEFQIRLVGLDSNGLNFADGSPANRSEPRTVRVIKDTVKPVLTKLEIISGIGDNQKVQEVPRVFVQGGSQIRVRATFSERLKVAPTLALKHQGNGAGEPSQPYSVPFDSQLFASNPTVVEYEFTPLFDPRNLGPVDLQFGPAAATISNAQIGIDMAGNDLDATQGVLKNQGTVIAGIVVDGNAPSLFRLTGAAGEVQSRPRNNQTLARKDFPTRIELFVQDYNLPSNLPGSVDASSEVTGRFDNGSGVDFDKVGSADMRVVVRRPNGTEIAGTLVTQPPNGLVYLLPLVEQIFGSETSTGNPEDANKPDAGAYTVQVSLIDKVGNKAVESIVFNMDVDPINAASIQVSLKPPGSPAAAGGINFSLKNPIKGSEIPDLPSMVDLSTLDSVNQLDGFDICSTDPTFSVTRSTIDLKARLNGPDTVARSLIITGTVDGNATNTCGTTGLGNFTVVKERQKEVFPNLPFDFPNPGTIGDHVRPGEKDPRFGQYDGPYLAEILAVDGPGNVSKAIRKEFLLDTTAPYTERTFPQENQKINTPLRHVSAVVVDPSPARLHTFEQSGKVNFGSGISIKASKMNLRLPAPYRDNLSTTLFDTADGNRLRGVLDFTHNPNSFDPTLPTFNPNDDAYRVLLEIVDNNANTVTLPVDGSVDGIYTVEVIPVDNAGNNVNDATTRGGFKPLTDGVKPPKELKRDFRFLLDTVPPNLTFSPIGAAQTAPSELNVNGGSFELKGKVRDLSARTPATEAIRGGSGMDRVEYSLVLLRQDGTMVDSQPGDGQDVKPRNNPILKDVKAELSAITDPSLDPSVSSTRPLTDGYRDLLMVEHTWTIKGVLPPPDEIIVPDQNTVANYVLIVKAIDQAGNISERRIVMKLNSGLLPPPELVSPNLNGALKSPAVVFEWKPVPEAAEYILNLSHPTGQLTTYAVVKSGDNPNVRWNQILTTQGEYEWWVLSVDSVGNAGQKGLTRKFRYDKEAPFIESLSWSDLSPEATTRMSIGTFKLQVVFNEELGKWPKVTFKPLQTSVPEQMIVTSRVSGKTWEGVATIPTTATNLWDGKATLEISQAEDKAGNLMIVNRNYDFTIDTGPSYSVKYFENPVYRTEVVMVVKSTENLLNVPVLTEPVGVSLATGTMLRISDSVFAANLRITASNDTTGKVRISGTDLDGNTASRILTFPVSVLKTNQSTRVLSTGLVLNVPSGSVAQNTPMMVLPREEFSEIPQINASVGSVSKEVQELKKIKDLELLSPTDIQFLQPVAVEMDPGQPLGPQQGLFLASGGSLELIEANVRDGKYHFSLMRSGQIMIFEDLKPPLLNLDSSLEQDGIRAVNPKVRFEAKDLGSGLRQDSIHVTLAGQQMAFEEVDARGAYVYGMKGRIANGDNELEIEVSDRLGNLSVLKSTVQVLGPIRISAIAYPNPARSFSMFSYDLSRAADHVELKLYDAAGALIHSINSAQDPLVTTVRGKNTWRWDLLDRRGRNVANGVYFVQVVARDRDGHQDRQRIRVAVLQ